MTTGIQPSLDAVCEVTGADRTAVQFVTDECAELLPACVPSWPNCSRSSIGRAPYCSPITRSPTKRLRISSTKSSTVSPVDAQLHDAVLLLDDAAIDL
jgi:hypothetical protein